MKKILFISLLVSICSCVHLSRKEDYPRGVLALKTDSTITLKVKSNIVDEYKLSELIDSVRYVALDNATDALLSIIRNIKVINDLIYVMDIDGRLKCFDSHGKYLRNGYAKGGGPAEIAHFIDFDVDEHYLYILDGAKRALFTFTHEGDFVKKENLPFMAEQFKHLPDNKYMFELSRFGMVEEFNTTGRTVLTDDKFRPIRSLLPYIENTRPMTVYPFFENSANSIYFCDGIGLGLFERRDTVIFMKYYLDFDGKYFNADIHVNGIELSVHEETYYAIRTPQHTEDYIIQAFYAGLRQPPGALFIRLKDNKTMFIKKLKQDRSDIINFSFGLATNGYNPKTNEFYGSANYINLDDIVEKDRYKIPELKQKAPPHARPFIFRQNTEESTNHILIFYTLKRDIEFP
jgi:hypothetical protein